MPDASDPRSGRRWEPMPERSGRIPRSESAGGGGERGAARHERSAITPAAVGRSVGGAARNERSAERPPAEHGRPRQDAGKKQCPQDAGGRSLRPVTRPLALFAFLVLTRCDGSSGAECHHSKAVFAPLQSRICATPKPRLRRSKAVFAPRFVGVFALFSKVLRRARDSRYR